MNKIILALVIMYGVAETSYAVPECSNARKILLGMQSYFSSQEQKNNALAEAVRLFDYCGAKYWLEQGVNVQEALKKRLQESNECLALGTSIIGPICLEQHNQQQMTKCLSC